MMTTKKAPTDYAKESDATSQHSVTESCHEEVWSEDGSEEMINTKLNEKISTQNENKIKEKGASRKLWQPEVNISTYLIVILQEDDAIVYLVNEYGTKRWTFVA